VGWIYYIYLACVECQGAWAAVSSLGVTEGLVLVQKLRRVGTSLVVTIPKDEVERQGLAEGELVAVEVRKLAIRPLLPPDLQAHVDKLRGNEKLTAALQRLKEG